MITSAPRPPVRSRIFCGVGVGYDGVVCSDLEGQLECLGFDINGDHLRSGGGAGDLDRDMPEAADADQHERGIRSELRPGSSDCVIRRQARVGQRRRGLRAQSVWQWHQVALMRNQQIVGHPAVQAEAPTTGQ
jgi:hypothetical protein